MQCPTVLSARRLSWAGWYAMTWRCCSASASPAALRDAPASVREPRPLPASTTSLVGREHDVDEVVSLAERPEVRLVTLTGPGGIGKTRLAVAAAQRLRDHFPGGTAFVPLAAVSDPGLLLASIGQAVGSDLTGSRIAGRGAGRAAG